MNDLRIAIRTLRATPIVTLVVILSLALGIGANTAIFSIADSLLLRALPVERPDRLVLLLSNAVNRSSAWSNPLWEQIRDHQADLFQATFAFSRRTTRFDLAQGGHTDFVDGSYASGQYFEGLGVTPRLGRSFTAKDDRRGGGPDGPVAVISDALWQRRFGGSPAVIGTTQTIDRVPFTIVGVMPPDFFGTDVGSRSDMILPIGTESLIRGPDSVLDRATTSSLLVMARLKDGQSVASAEAALRGIQPQIREATMPANQSAAARARHLATPFGVEPAASGPSAMRGRYRQPILAIMAVVALVLLVACANVANLVLARAAARRREFSVRLAIGATRWRLARQQLAESLLLAAAGSAAGLGIARWASDLLIQQLSTHANTVFLDTSLDWRVLAFTVAVGIVVALLFGVVPALRASRIAPIEAIREYGRGTAGERGVGAGGALVAGQVALSFVLVVAAGLFIRTFATLATLNLGFDRDPVLLVRLDPPRTSAEPSERAALYERVAATVRAMPGVSHTAISEVTPVSGMITDVYVEAENGPLLAPPQNVSYRNVITPDWFATYGTRLVAGRDFDDRDRLASPPVAIVNETFARRFLQGANPLGRRIRNPSSAPGETRPWMEVVGVVADATYLSLRDAVPPTMYVPLAQRPAGSGFFPFATLSVRAADGRPALLARGVGDAIARVDPDIAITFTPLKQQVDAALVQERIMAMLSGWFSALALLLSALGLYGVTAYSVNRRRTEIGIRMAIGAAPARVVRLVLTRVTILLGIGLLIGAVASVWASRFIAALLYGLEPRDPATLISSAAVLAVVGALAAWLPAYRASSIAPAEVLREG
ncbi:MAG TPA: ABC transporter permease [Vicinamibacterales bacterium]|nr:ABC transporter permease [Vicinamibacterales bacterium]